jgi:hypothetical protein
VEILPQRFGFRKLKYDSSPGIEKMHLDSSSRLEIKNLLFSTHVWALPHQKNDSLGYREKIKKREELKSLFLMAMRLTGNKHSFHQILDSSMM